METLTLIIEFIVHIDVYLKDIVLAHGALVYGLLFLIIFCETGLVVAPFLPGDSLLFVAGTLVGAGLLSVGLLIPLLIVAAIAGDTCNFHIGKAFGGSLLQRKKHRFVKIEYIEKAQLFYRKHGGKAIILARFIPFVRTFVPFIAGIGRMDYRRFWLFNAIGGIIWVSAFVLAGIAFGANPWVADNMSLLVWGVVIMSVVPMLVAGLKARFGRNRPIKPEVKQLADTRRSS